MALIKREPIIQPSLMNVAKGANRSSTDASISRKKIQPEAFWPSVGITPEAKERLGSLEIQFHSMDRAFQSTLSSILEMVRNRQMAVVEGFAQVPIMPVDDVPGDITLVFQYSRDSVVVVDVRRPLQPSLF